MCSPRAFSLPLVAMVGQGRALIVSASLLQIWWRKRPSIGRRMQGCDTFSPKAPSVHISEQRCEGVGIIKEFVWKCRPTGSGRGLYFQEKNRNRHRRHDFRFFRGLSLLPLPFL